MMRARGRAGIFALVTIVMAVIVASAFALTTTPATTGPADGKLDFGEEGLAFPPAVPVNAHTSRTAQLLGDAYRKKDPLEWKRVQFVADLGQVALSASAPYLIDAMRDESPAVRAQAARSAGMIPSVTAALLAELEKLLGDPDPGVRREAVLSAVALARAAEGAKTNAIERGLADADARVAAAAMQRAWTAEHAQQVAAKLPTLPKNLAPEAAAALARLKAGPQAEAVLPLLGGDVVERAAAVRALGEMGNAQHVAAVEKMLSDLHPTVRREAMTAVAKLAQPEQRESAAIRMLADADPTVREAAAVVLTPVPSVAAMKALLPQLDIDYAPLHRATRAALVRPADAPVRDATIAAAAAMLTHDHPRRREDASYVLGRLRSAERFEQHVALLPDPSKLEKVDWPLVAQAAESLGLIGDARAAEPLMALVKPAPDSLAKLNLKTSEYVVAAQAVSNALAALGRIGHRPAMDEAVRVVKLDPLGGVPGNMRTAAAFVIGAVGEPGRVPGAVNFLELYASTNESVDTKFESLKALGNLRHAGSAKRLKEISETDGSPNLRWIAHWAYQRVANTTVPYTPPIEPRQPPVTITDIAR